MIGQLAFIAALMAAPPVAAQEADKPATAEQIAQAKAIADRLIGSAEAEGVFVNSTHDAIARVTHVASGMTCMFDGGPEDRIYIFPNQDDEVPRGDDVGCITRDEALDIDLTLYATRYRPLPEEAAVMADARNAIENRWPDAKPYTGDLTTLSLEGQAPTLMTAYRIMLGDEEKLTMALVSHRDGWGFKARATGPYEDATGVSLYAGILFEGALMARAAGSPRNP